MSYATLAIPLDVLEGMLHLREHEIEITHAKCELRHQRVYLVMQLVGDGLPCCEVNAILRRLDDGREVLARLEPIRP